MPISFCPDSFRSPGQERITIAQAAYLKAKGIEAGISDGYDEHWIEDWLFSEFGVVVGDVEDLTRDQFRDVLEEMEWDQ